MTSDLDPRVAGAGGPTGCTEASPRRAGRAGDPAGPAGKAGDQAGRAGDPAGPAGKAGDQAGRAGDPAGRGGAGRRGRAALLHAGVLVATTAVFAAVEPKFPKLVGD